MATQKSLIIDTHVHVWEMPPNAPIGPTAPSWKSMPREHGNIELLLSDIQANKVDRAVIVQTSWSTWDNTYLSQASHRYPDKFVAMGLIDPQSIDNSITAVKWMDNYGIQGFRFHPMYYDNFEILICPGNRAMFKKTMLPNGSRARCISHADTGQFRLQRPSGNLDRFPAQAAPERLESRRV